MNTKGENKAGPGVSPGPGLVNMIADGSATLTLKSAK